MWKSDSDGECRPRRRKRGRATPLEPTQSTGIFFDNGEHSHVMLYNRTTQQTMDLPDDGLVLIVLDRTAAYEMRDQLLDPNEFPESIHE